jgi:hypothetical protein
VYVDWIPILSRPDRAPSNLLIVFTNEPYLPPEVRRMGGAMPGSARW